MTLEYKHFLLTLHKTAAILLQDGSLPFARSISDTQSEFRLLSKLTELLMKHGDQEEALQYATLAVQIAEKTGTAIVRKHTTGRQLVFWGDQWVLSLLFRCHYQWTHGVPPACHGLLQPPAVRDGGELLPQVPGLLSRRPGDAGRGSLLHQALLSTGQLHSAQAEGRRAKCPRHNYTIRHSWPHLLKGALRSIKNDFWTMIVQHSQQQMRENKRHWFNTWIIRKKGRKND